MTVIVWDGETLAADKRADSNGLRRTVTKIRKGRGGCLLAVSGNFAFGNEMMAWWDAGAEPDKFPALQRDKDEYVDLLVITAEHKITKYERSPWPMTLEDKKFAMGSGRDFALAAMYLGRNAVDAVLVASMFCTGCGDGVDTLTLE